MLLKDVSGMVLLKRRYPVSPGICFSPGAAAIPPSSSVDLPDRVAWTFHE